MTEEVQEAEKIESKTPAKPRQQRASKHTGLHARVRTFFQRHADQLVYTPQLLKELKLPQKVVLNAIHQLRAKGEPIAIVERGNIYTWRSNQLDPVFRPANPATYLADAQRLAEVDVAPVEPARHTFTEVGPTKDGWYVIQAEDGALFKAEPL